MAHTDDTSGSRRADLTGAAAALPSRRMPRVVRRFLETEAAGLGRPRHHGRRRPRTAGARPPRAGRREGARQGRRGPWSPRIGAIGGIGFTVALFIAELAFEAGILQDAAKIGVLTASTVAAVLGAVVLYRACRSRPVDAEAVAS